MSRCAVVCSSGELKKVAEDDKMNSTDESNDSDLEIICVNLNGEKKESSVAEDDKMNSTDESNDSDLEIICVNSSGDKKDSSNVKSLKNASNGEQVNVGPILSLACLYEDDEVPQAPGSNSVKSDFTNTVEVPGSILKCILQNESKEPQSSKGNSDEKADISDISERDELTKSFKDKSPELQSSTSNSDEEELSIDMSEVPELTINCAEDNSKESMSSITESSADEISEENEEISGLIVKSNDRDTTKEHQSSTNSCEEPDTIIPDVIDVAEVPDLMENSVNEDNEHPNITSINGMPQPVSFNNSRIFSNHNHPSIPARNAFEGNHKFKIRFENQTDKKSDPIIYCELKNKLYVAKDYPVKVLVSAENVPSGSRLKMFAAFALPEHGLEVVRRCPTHSHQDSLQGHPAYEHLVLSHGKTAVYEKNENVLSVSVPYEEPHYGETFTSYLFKLTCFSSCSGGINRRPFMLVFSLENDGNVLGRQTIETKICACPLRDYQSEIKKVAFGPRNEGRSDPSPERSFMSRETSAGFSLSVKDPELFQFLQQMKVLYETSAKVKYMDKKPL